MTVNQFAKIKAGIKGESSEMLKERSVLSWLIGSIIDEILRALAPRCRDTVPP